MIERLLTKAELLERGAIPSPCEEYKLLKHEEKYLVYELNAEGKYDLLVSFKPSKPIDLEALRRGGL